jgi:hypothetical protein
MRSNQFGSKGTVRMSQFVLTASLFLILSCSAISQMGNSPQDCDALFAQAAELEKQGNLIGAAALYDRCQQSAHEQKLRHLEAASLHRVAVIKAQSKKFTESAGLFRRSIALDDKNVMVLCDFAQLYADRRMYDDAETILKNALLIDPNHTHILLNLGTIIAMQGDRQTEGLRYLKLALGEKAAYLELAKLYRSKGDMGQAEFAEQRAKLATDNPPAPVPVVLQPARETAQPPIVPVPIPPATQPPARETAFQPERKVRPEVLQRVKEELLLLETQEIAAQQNTMTAPPVYETPKPDQRGPVDPWGVTPKTVTAAPAEKKPAYADPFLDVPIPVTHPVAQQPVRETAQQPVSKKPIHEMIAPYETITAPSVLRDPFIPAPQQSTPQKLEWTAAKSKQSTPIPPPAPAPKPAQKIVQKIQSEVTFERPSIAVVQPPKQSVLSETLTDFNPAKSQRTDSGTLLKITAPPQSEENNTLRRLSLPKQINEQINAPTIRVIPATERISNERQLANSARHEQVKPIPLDPSSNVSIIAALPEYAAINIRKTPAVEDRDKLLTVQSNQLVLNRRTELPKRSTVANENSSAKIAFVRQKPADTQAAALTAKPVKTDHSSPPGIVQPIGLISLDTRQPVSTIRPSGGSNSGFLVAQRNIVRQAEMPKPETPKPVIIQEVLPKDAVVAPSEHQFARNTSPNVLAFEVIKEETPKKATLKEEPKKKPFPTPGRETDPFLMDAETFMPNSDVDEIMRTSPEPVMVPDMFWDLSVTPSGTPLDNSNRGFATTQSNSPESTDANADSSDDSTGFARSKKEE